MLRSMFAGVSGLRTHQAYMDVVGNNIANVNTMGYKTSNALFQDLLSQSVRGAGAPGTTVGGTNPAQVGLGVRLAGITMNMAQGASQLTGRSTDFAIQGDGFFVVQQGGARFYARAGSFSLDAQGRVVTPDGGFVQGWQATPTGAINTNATVGNLSVPVGQTIAPIATSSVDIGGNLPAESAVGTTINTTITTYTSLGVQVPLRVEYTKVANLAGQVNWQVRTYAGAQQVSGPADLTFDLDGNRISGAITIGVADPDGAGPNVGLDGITGTTGSWPGPITLDFGAPGDADRLTGSAGLNSVAALSQNGSPIGSLVSFSVAADGTISGVFSNGRSQPLGQMALAVFSNPVGLEKAGGSLYTSTVNSGNPIIGVPGTGGRGSLAGATLEMSNVDLAAEFTNLITAQRGFQANSRIITASDEILQDLVNLKR